MGCSALVEPHMYAATNRSLTEVEVLEVNISLLTDLMHKDCQLGLKLQQQLLKFMMGHIMELRNLLANR